MKRIILVSILSGIIAVAFAEKGWVITQRMESSSMTAQTVTVSWYVTKENCKMKMDYSDAKVKSTNWFIPDLQQNSLLIYTEGPVPAGAQKAFYSIPLQGINKGKSKDGSNVGVNKTGETKNISGMLCEKITVTTANNITEMWVAKDIKTDLYKFYPFFQSSLELLGLNEGKIPGFPVSSVTKDNSGNVTTSSQLISVQSSELSESDFKVPAEYKNSAEISRKKD